MDYLGYWSFGASIQTLQVARPKGREESSGPQAALKQIVDYFVANFGPPKSYPSLLMFKSISSL